MAANHFGNIFQQTLKQEAGYQAMASDPGNYCGGKLVGTKYGIGAQAYKAVYGVCPSPAAMKNLTVDQAKMIWKKTVWDNIKGDEIKSEAVCAMLLFATGGGKSGYKSMRETLNIIAKKKVVNEVGPPNLTAAEVALINNDVNSFFHEFYNVRLRYFKNHSNKKFIKGWINRLNEIYDTYKINVSKPVQKPFSFSPFS